MHVDGRIIKLNIKIRTIEDIEDLECVTSNLDQL